MLNNLRHRATLKKAISFQGQGVHSGLQSNIKILPARANVGIVFKRIDVRDKDNIINLSAHSVFEPTMCTRLKNEAGVSVSVVEHLLASLKIFKITDAIIEVDSPEIPIMDGSGKVFMDYFSLTGQEIFENDFVPSFVVEKTIKVENNGAYIEVKPSRRFLVNVELTNEKILKVVKNQNNLRFDFSQKSLIHKIAEARTFGWLADYEKVKSLGLAKGASLDNTIVITENNTIANDNGLRSSKELVMHKCLDFIGDISVLDFDIVADIKCVNPSHFLNNLFTRKIEESYEDYKLFIDKSENKLNFNHCF